MNTIKPIPVEGSRGNRSKLIWIEDELWAAPSWDKDRMTYVCSNCNKNLGVTFKSDYEICECGAHVNLLPLVWSDDSDSYKREYECIWSTDDGQ